MEVAHGDLVIVDNLPAHHGEAEDALTDFLKEILIDLLYLPVYSPDLNLVEECFSKMKYLLKYPLTDMVYQNLELAILHAVEAIEPADLVGYFRHCMHQLFGCMKGHVGPNDTQRLYLDESRSRQCGFLSTNYRN